MFEHPQVLEQAMRELVSAGVAQEALCLVAKSTVVQRQHSGVDGPLLCAVWRNREMQPDDMLITSGRAFEHAMPAGHCSSEALEEHLGAWMPKSHARSVAAHLACGWLLLCVPIDNAVHELQVPTILLRHSAAAVQVHEFSRRSAMPASGLNRRAKSGSTA
jgi:hypothetical protein